MASHLEMGKAGERLAEAYLAELGYRILHRNWRCGHEEIDLVACKDDLLRFVEVKYRTADYLGHPEEAVTKKKLRTLLRGIENYLHLHPQWDDFRLEILAITDKPGEETAYFLIEDVTL